MDVRPGGGKCGKLKRYRQYTGTWNPSHIIKFKPLKTAEQWDSFVWTTPHPHFCDQPHLRLFFFFLVSSWCFICGRIDTYSVIPKRKKATTAWLTKYLLNDVIVLSLVLVTELRSKEDTDKSFKTHRACWQCAENPPSTCQIHCIFQIILHGCTPPLTSKYHSWCYIYY